MNLQSKLDAIREDFETNKAPADVVTIFHAHRDKLLASGQAQRAVGISQTAPEFNLPGRSGNVKLSDLRATGPVVLTWFRGTW